MNIEQIKQLKGENAFANIDLEFARFICRKQPDNAMLFAAAALASYAVRHGDSCLNLADHAGKIFPPDKDSPVRLKMPELNLWLEELTRHEGVIAVYPENPAPATPLILNRISEEKVLLYLNRYFQYETAVAEKTAIHCMKNDINEFSPAELSARFTPGSEIDYQQAAVYLASNNNFSIITGGPGTGKTTVATALLAAELQKNPELRIALCAPTGKAQARLMESISEEVENLKSPASIKEELTALKNHCSTIHKLLQPTGRKQIFRFNKDNRLPIDLLLVDESSMVGLSLMAKLLAAVPDDAKIILLGDENQLPSVEAGSVLADLCRSGTVNTMRTDVAARFRQQTSLDFPVVSDTKPLSGRIAGLVKNHRSATAPFIISISEKIRSAVHTEALAEEIAHLKEADFTTLAEKVSPEKVLGEEAEILKALPHLMQNCADEAALDKAFKIIEDFQILAAIRKGPQGVEELNAMLRRFLRMPENGLTAGLPVLVTQNSTENDLNNGDIGLTGKSADGKTRVYFRSNEPGMKFRSFLPAELPTYEDAFALTIHKSQGSGYRKVVIVLPDTDNPVLTRELLYTAITRARNHVLLLGSQEIIQTALKRRTIRQSGLSERLKINNGEANAE